jgi:hypothetical protein
VVVWAQNGGEGESYHGRCPFIPKVEGLWWSRFISRMGRVGGIGLGKDGSGEDKKGSGKVPCLGRMVAASF